MRWLLWAAVVDLLVMVATVFVPGDEASFALSVRLNPISRLGEMMPCTGWFAAEWNGAPVS